MKIRYIASVAMVATAAAIGLAPLRRGRVHDHKHRRGDSGPVAGQRADHHSAWGCGAAGRPAAIPVLRIRRRVAVPPRRPPLTAVPFVRSGGKPPHPPERTLGSGQTCRSAVAHARQRSAGSRRPSSATGSGADTGRVCGAWRCAAGGMGSVAGGFAAAMVVRCHRIIDRRGDARGARSASGGSAADLGSALIR